MMHRYSRNSQRETRRSAVILGLSALAIGGTAVALPWMRKPVRAADNGCLAGMASRRTLVLVDRTDAWTPSTASLLAASLKRIAEDAETEERLLLMPFDGNAAVVPEAIFDRCKLPASGNALIETPKRVAKRHEEQFTTPLLEALRTLAKPSSAPRTELVRMLAVLADKARLDGPHEPLTLHVFSDMEENSAAFSFTKRPAQPLEQFAQYFAATIGDRLRHVSLRLHVLPPVGSSTRTDPRIERAWRAALSLHAVQFTWGPL